ncbi:MAG: hypothetical protein ACPG4Z_07415 [Chitinophagales bacterium]
MQEILSSIAVFGLSTVKFLLGLVTAMLNQELGLIPSYVLTVGGGIVGVFIFTYFGDFILKAWQHFFPGRTKRIFTSWNRFLVKFRRNFGVTGIAFLTPILSIPIGIFLSLSVEQKKGKIIGLMALSFVVWASVFFLPLHFFDFNLRDFIVGLF